MKEKQYQFATQIYLFLALGGLILIYGCCIELGEAAAHPHKSQEQGRAHTPSQCSPHFHFKVRHEYSYVWAACILIWFTEPLQHLSYQAEDLLSCAGLYLIHIFHTCRPSSSSHLSRSAGKARSEWAHMPNNLHFLSSLAAWNTVSKLF